MIERRCSKCNGELYIESPPFSEMSEQDISDWKSCGGRVMIICGECGLEDKKEIGGIEK